MSDRPTPHKGKRQSWSDEENSLILQYVKEIINQKISRQRAIGEIKKLINRSHNAIYRRLIIEVQNYEILSNSDSAKDRKVIFYTDRIIDYLTQKRVEVFEQPYTDRDQFSGIVVAVIGPKAEEFLGLYREWCFNNQLFLNKK